MNENNKNVKWDITEKWGKKKKMNKQIAEKLFEVGEKRRGQRVKECSEYLLMQKCPKCGEKHLARAELCKDRICPICQWRLARKRAGEMLQVLKEMEKKGYKYQFLTLTQKNIPIYRLGEEIKKINNAWKRIISSRVTGKPLGYARILEITYDEKTKTAHPHQHIIIAWEKGQRTYKRTEWAKRWGKALNVKYEPICRLKYIKSKEKNEKYEKAVLEAYKYSVKSTDLLKMPNELFKLFINEIKGTKACSYTGIFRELRKELKMKKETEIEDINEEDIKCKECGSEMIKYVLEWSYADERYKEVIEFD